jgi:hypothetical protein
MAFAWFDAKDAEAFGVTLAKYYIDRVPVASSRDGKRSLDKQAQAIAGMVRLREHFASTHKLNIYKKAQMANTFKGTLRAAGYPDDLSNKLTFDIVMRG